MVKRFVYILIIGLLTASVQAADSSSQKIRVNSNTQFNYSCRAVYKNFRADHAFSTYLKNRCVLFESGRQQAIGLVFPFPNHREAGYNSRYQSLVASYTESMNNQELGQIKALVTEYCKHNAYKFAKKAPGACSQKTINSLF